MDDLPDVRGGFDVVQVAEDALLPAELRGAMWNVTIPVEDEPPPGQPLLGLYQGVPLTRRTSGYVGAPRTRSPFTPARSSVCTARPVSV